MLTGPKAFGIVVALVGLAFCAEPSVAQSPMSDPRVNPPSLSEPAPSDMKGVDLSATVYRVLRGSPRSLSPIFRSSTYEFYFAELMFPTLVVWDAQMRWQPHPDLVEEYSESEDHSEATIRLRAGLTWHDGRPFTADDVVFSWEVIRDALVPVPAMRVGTDQIAECRAIDSRTILFRHKKASPVSPANLAFSIVPKHIYEPGRAADPTLRDSDYFNRVHRNPVGYGPYRFVEWVENDRIVLERWDGFSGRKPYIKRVVFRIVPDSQSAFLLFKKGELDELPLTAAQFSSESSDERFARRAVKALATRWDYAYIGWNQDGSNPFFFDTRVRRAMTQAVNTPLMIEKIYQNLVTPCFGIYHPDFWAFDRSIRRIEYDLTAAASELDRAGWRVSEEDGWRHKDGTRLKFTMLVPIGSESGPVVSAILQDDLRKIGVDMHVQNIEWAAYLERVRAHDFEACIAAWGMDPDPDSGWNIWRSDQYDDGRNYIGYSNARVDELYSKGRELFDPKGRRDCYREIQKLIYRDQPYTFLWNRSSLWAFSRRLGGVELSPRGIGSFYPGMLNWWVRKDGKTPAENR